MLSVARTVVATQGISGLFKGGVAHLLIAPYTVLYYSLYDEILTRGRAATATADGDGGHPLVPLGAALCARTLETSVRMPLEVLRTVMQTSDGSVTLSGTLRHLASQPPSVWFRGMVPTLLRDVPFSAIYWLSYEQAKERVAELPKDWAPRRSVRTLVHSFVCGAGAGCVAAVLTTPVDVIKTVRQHEIATGGQTSYLGILRIIRDNPALGFAGVAPRMIRIPAGMATMMAGLEVTKWWFAARAEERRGARV